MKKLGLLPRVGLAIILGIICGIMLPESIIRFFTTFNALFSEFLGFVIPLIIIGLVVPSIADLGKGAGRLLLFTALVAYGSTLFSGFYTYICTWKALPFLLPNQNIDPELVNKMDELSPYFTIQFPPAIDVMSALVLSFMIGLGIAFTHAQQLKNIMNEFKNIIELLIHKVIVPLLPIYILGVFCSMSHNGHILEIILVFLRIIILVFILQALLLIFQFMIAGSIAKKNPWRLLRNMIPAYLTALGTSSSAATIPVTLDQTLKNGVEEDVANFTIPLCATIHLSGSTMKIVAFAMALMMMTGMEINFSLFAGFIFMLGITMIAAPGVPGGAIVAALGLLQSMLGFDENMQALMVALYVAIDSFGTACNVTGDGAIAVVINRFVLKKPNKNNL